DFQWNTQLNLSSVLYKHKERFAFEVIPQGGQVTDPVNSIYAYKTNGILQIGEAAPAWQPANAKNPGAPRFVDLSGDKILDKNDIIRFDASPNITIGFGNSLSYKQFDLGFLFYSQFGGWGYNNLISWATPGGIIAGNQSGIKEVKDIWTSSNPMGTLPGVAYDEFALGLAAGVDNRLEKTDFVRCRNITLGYTFNQPAVNRYFKNLRVYADVQNPFIITNYKIGDPEVQAAGVKGGPAPYPMATTYSFGVKTNF
ncbi:MAG: SusC/RagA family TonB-linked outer membrane protein, partial [Ferruginibacter sp.]|nr:SusC/RagA family TonB-linked outer membrane protein [Ferruginibacter sp.]